MPSQRSLMRQIWERTKPDQQRAVAEYAAAELRGEVQRTSNSTALSAEQYAYRLLQDGLKKGWLQTPIGRYGGITSLFLRLAEEATTVSFSLDQLQNAAGRELPASALKHGAWWGNSSSSGSGAPWLVAGWKTVRPQPSSGSITFARSSGQARSPAPSRGPRGLPSIADGAAQLEAVLKAAGYPSVVSAVAKHAIFLHPRTVAQTHGQPIVPVIRSGFSLPRGEYVERDGRMVLADDNGPPTTVFLWAAQRKRGTDVQYNHIWAKSDDWRCYTALWNLCVTPSFLAKTTDTNPLVKAALRRRSWELYGALPEGEAEPTVPPGYDQLQWAPHPPLVQNLETVFRQRMAAAPKNNVTRCAASEGWLFSDFRPDQTVSG